MFDEWIGSRIGSWDEFLPFLSVFLKISWQGFSLIGKDFLYIFQILTIMLIGVNFESSIYLTTLKESHRDYT